MTATNIVRVRRLDDQCTRRMHGQFTYKLLYESGVSKERVFNFNRLISEPNSEALSRLQCNISKRLEDNYRKKNRSAAKAVDVNTEVFIDIKLFDEHGTEVDGSVPNSEAWVDGGSLKIEDVLYSIEVNPPRILEARLPSVIMTGFPVIPEFTLEFADRLECDFEWSQAAVPEVLIGCDFLYTPTVKDIGHRLTLTIIPKRGDRQGFSVTVVSDSEVKTGPDLLPILSRQNLPVKDTSVNNCRVVSYNLLAHTYTDTEFSRKELFSHCPVGYLEYDYRKSLIAKELLGYNADVICLQEVDNSQFSNYYQPLFRFHGYSSFLCSKRHYKIPKNWHAVEEEPTVNMDCEEKGDESLTEASVGTEGEGQIICSEGSAILFKDSKFRLVADCTINIATALETDSRYADIKEAAMNSRLVTEKLFYRSGCCVQTVVLESRDDKSKRLCLATTHLYFHPLGSVVRLLQTAVALRHIHSVKSSYKSEGCSMPVLFCGDFNSAPNSKIVQLVRSRGVSDNDGVWNENALYSMEGVNLQHSLYLETACGFPKYTNYVPQFKECIDYIFYEKHCFSVESVTSLPSEEFMASHRNGIPSENFPSDHLALCCELSWLPLE